MQFCLFFFFFISTFFQSVSQWSHNMQGSMIWSQATEGNLILTSMLLLNKLNCYSIIYLLVHLMSLVFQQGITKYNLVYSCFFIIIIILFPKYIYIYIYFCTDNKKQNSQVSPVITSLWWRDWPDSSYLCKPLTE